MSTRRLAAIMFADIVGYTTMMQRNEKTGLANVHRFSEVIEAQAETYHGEVLEFRGDGCLAVFDSAVQAMHAAKAIQEQLQQAPIIPLRIGIHIGDIVFTKGNIYGDGVNLASRVESMGVPGSILVTERVIHDVKSHPEFEMASLGRFQFKNVEKPMEVFALSNEGFAVPKPEEMKGKGEKVKAKHPVVLLAGLVVGAMIVGAGLFWAFGSSDTDQKLLSADIRDEKVAVSVFENFTKDEDLDALGYMGSEWIGSGLRELKVRTVSPEMVRQHNDRIGILPNNPENEPSFAEITGAKYVITGSYFMQGDSIVLNTRLSSTETGEEVYSFPKLMGHKDQKEAMIEEAREYLLGYWVLKKDRTKVLVHPPKYEAYQKWLSCGRSCLEEVLELDPDFMLARVWILIGHTYYGSDSAYLAIKSSIENSKYPLTEFEKNMFQFAEALRAGNYSGAFKALNANHKLDPKDVSMIHESNIIARVWLRQTQMAVERYQPIFEKFDIYQKQIGNTDAMLEYAYALLEQKNYAEVIRLYEEFSISIELRHPLFLRVVIISYIYLNRLEEVFGIVELTRNQISEKRAQEHLLDAAYAFAYIHDGAKEGPNPFQEMLLSGIELLEEPADASVSDPPFSLYYDVRYYDSRYLAYYVLEDFEKAEGELKKVDLLEWENEFRAFIHSRNDGNDELWLTGAWACLYAQQGKLDACYAKLQELEMLRNKYESGPRIVYLRGAGAHLEARVYAILGEKEKAVESLREAIEQGRHFLWGNITSDIDLMKHLKGYEPFEELIRPRG